MKLDIKGKERLIIVILLALLSLCIIYLVLGKISERKYKKYYKDQIETLKNENKASIEKSENKINYLLEDNKRKDIAIVRAFSQIDSLESIKGKVLIKYVIKYKEITKYNSSQVKNYWENEFKK